MLMPKAVVDEVRNGLVELSEVVRVLVEEHAPEEAVYLEQVAQAIHTTVAGCYMAVDQSISDAVTGLFETYAGAPLVVDEVFKERDDVFNRVYGDIKSTEPFDTIICTLDNQQEVRRAYLYKYKGCIVAEDIFSGWMESSGPDAFIFRKQDFDVVFEGR